jgi:hypothetical protein
VQCASFFSKLEMILTLIIFFKKELKLMKFIFTTHSMNAFGSILCFFILKIMNFEDVAFTKVVDFLW